MAKLQRRALTGTTLVVLAIIFVALVVLSGALLRGVRLDLTENRLYTLTDGTLAILDKLEEPVNLYFFYSEEAAEAVPGLDLYADRVRELLEEIAAKSDGMVRLETIDPVPFSEAEDRAAAYGLQSVPLGNTGESLFFGLAGTNATDGQAAIPFFQPDKETFLEYDVAKLIASLADTARPRVGLLSTLPMSGSFDPQMGRPTPGWVIETELRELFDVQAVQANATGLPDDLDLLVVVHPKELSSELAYAIDQFVLGGGRLVVFVDPNAEAQAPPPGSDPTAAMFQPRASDFATLFDGWGVQFDAGQVVLDAQNALQIQGADGRATRHLAILGLGREDMNQDDVVSAELEAVNLSTAGHIGLADDATLTLEPLLETSDAAATVAADRIRFLPDPASLFDGFTPTGHSYVLAARLTGPLRTAFPDRSGEGHVAESAEPVNLIVVADTDVLSDRLWVQVQQFFGQRIFNAFADNGDFIVNAVDNLVGSSDLIAVRARATSVRPFGTVDALRRQADDRFRAKEQELQQQLAETERKLTELQSARSDEDTLILTPEQRAELQRFQDEKLRVRKELREVRRELDADIDALGARLKFLNIAGMPILITLFALGFAFWRARRRRAGKEATR